MSLEGRTCVVSGTFDPLTKGHLDVMRRAAKLFDGIYVLIAAGSSKSGRALEYEDRAAIVAEEMKGIGRPFEIVKIGGALAKQAAELGAAAIVRGLRNEQDLVYETDMSSVNRLLSPGIETVYLPCDPSLSYVSSSAVRELCRLGEWMAAYRFCPKSAMKRMKAALSLKVAVTGSIGCGKSRALKEFADRGWTVISCDDAWNLMMSWPYAGQVAEMVRRLQVAGKDVFEWAGSRIDRKKFAKAVFSDPDVQKIIRETVWPAVAAEVRRRIEDFTKPGDRFAVEIPMMFEQGDRSFDGTFDRTLCVTASVEARLSRLTKKRGYSASEAANRIASQMDPYEKAKLCTDSIDNSGCELEIKTRLGSWIDEIERGRR